jgi:predicted membrane protein
LLRFCFAGFIHPVVFSAVLILLPLRPAIWFSVARSRVFLVNIFLRSIFYARLHLAVGPRFAACVIQIFGISIAARQVVHALIFMLQFFVLRHEQQVFAAVCDFIVCISGLDFVACFLQPLLILELPDKKT